MPPSTIDYSKTLIYKIQHEDDESLLYIGHTTNFAKRKCEHKRCCNSENDKLHNIKLYKMLRDNGGWECFKMVVIKPFPCENKLQADAEEDRVMLEFKSNINNNSAVDSKEQLDNSTIDEYHKEYHKKYYLEFGDIIKEYNKNYKAKNFDKIKENNKQYYIKNCGIIKENRKQQYLDNKSKENNQKITCECGCIVAESHLPTHKKTTKHANNMLGK
jgi:hypothetical protein